MLSEFRFTFIGEFRSKVRMWREGLKIDSLEFQLFYNILDNISHTLLNVFNLYNILSYFIG